jgi:DNA-binding phage protein
MKKYTMYVFKERDPIIEELRSVVADSGLRYKQIAETGVSTSTLYSWFKKKKTRRPQFATISNVALACGAQGIKFVDGRPVFIMPPRARLKVVAGGKK